MNFHNVRFPNFLEIFIAGGPVFSTSCAHSMSGREIRSADRLDSLNKYILKDCYLSQEQFQEFNNFFRGREGQRYSFKIKDYSDFKATKQLIGRGEGTLKEFQLYKLYNDQISPYTRKITKPINGSVKLYKDTEEINIDSLNLLTGIVGLSRELKQGELLFADFEFDVPVRFMQDSFKYSFRNDGSIELINIELLEVQE